MKGVDALGELLDRLSPELAEQAVTHSSWVEHRSESFDRLAFLGDRLLGITVANEVYRRFPDADAGELTQTHAQAVSTRACASVADDLGLKQRLIERAPDDESGRSLEELLRRERPIAEIAEAVIGACFLEHGFEPTRAAVAEAFAEEIEYASKTRLDFKSELQERLAQSGATVTYEVTNEEGPPHDRRFDVTASARGEKLGSGSGRSKKEAEQAAAEEALEKITG